MHIKKSHNFAVKKGRVAHILVPFMVGAICGLALADPNLDSNQEKNTYEIVTLTTISKMYFFFLQNGSEIGTSSVLEFGLLLETILQYFHGKQSSFKKKNGVLNIIGQCHQK